MFLVRNLYILLFVANDIEHSKYTRKKAEFVLIVGPGPVIILNIVNLT